MKIKNKYRDELISVVYAVRDFIYTAAAKKPDKRQIEETIWGYDFILTNKKDKITFTDNCIITQNRCPDLENFLNSHYWRFEELINGTVRSFKDNNNLCTIITLRHIYETMAHVYYCLQLLFVELKKYNGKKFFKTLWNFLTAVEIDFTGKTNVVGKPISVINKLPHINDSIIIFNKNLTMVKNQLDEEDIFMKGKAGDMHKLYEWASQVAHPNSMGSVRFYGFHPHDPQTYLYSNSSLEEKGLGDQRDIRYTKEFYFLAVIKEFH